MGLELGLGCLLAASGCTRDNGAFDAGADAMTSEGTAADTEPDATTGMTTAPTTGVSTSGTTTDVPDGTTESTDTTDTTQPDTEGSTGAPLCVLHDHAEILINVLEGGAVAAEPPAGCLQPLVRTNGSITIEAGTIVHEQCDCPCVGEGEITVLDFEGTLALPAMLPDCGSLVAWPRMTDGGCTWDGFAVSGPSTPELPAYLGNNSTKLPNIPFGAVDVHLVPDGPACDTPPMDCMQPTGRYALEFFSNTPVPVGVPTVVEIGFVAGAPYEVVNRTSSVTEECTEQVAWTAQMQG